MTRHRFRMKRRSKVLIGVAAGVVVVGGVVAIAGPAFYRDVIVGEPEAAPTVSVTPGDSALAGSDLTGSWSVGSGSTAGYRVDEVLNGTDVTVVGKTSDVTGTVDFDSDSITKADITVDVASIATDSTSRDEYFRTSALETDIHPDATFTLTSPLDTGDLSDGDVTKFTATGKLTMHGVTKTVSVPMQAALSGDGAEVSGSIPVTFADYKVAAPSLGFVKVEDSGSVEFLLKASPAA